MKWLDVIHDLYGKSDFAVARSIKFSLAGADDPDQQRRDMKLWCRDKCQDRWAKRWADTPDQAWFDFQSDDDALLFLLRWC